MRIVHVCLCLALPLLLTGCNSAPTTPTASTTPLAAPTTPGEKCSVKLPSIEFTQSLNNAAKNATTTNGKLSLRSEAKKDNFNDPDGKLTNNTAPVLLTRIDNKKPFTLTAKVTPEFLETYDAGVLYIYNKEDLWQKFAFERDERAKTRIVSVRTIGTSDDNNHDVVGNKSVYMKISSDTKTVGFYYSLDNATWQLVRLYKNDYPAETWVGVSSQSPIGNGSVTQFEDCTLTETSIKDFRMGV
jgi:regulation of enolase protein 1 (concanavalin A-like superfamily)